MVSALQKLGKYLFLEEQEFSEVGQIWRASELASGKITRNLLVDVVQQGFAQDAGFREQYLDQSSITAKLEHPNILRTIATDQDASTLHTFYEYHEGFTLEKVMKRCQEAGGPLSIDHGLLVVSKLLAALVYSKTKHLTHGFVNPSMIFVTHEGEIKLKGFPFSSAMRAASSPPNLSDYYHTYVPAGMSLNDKDRDRLDIYGCGAILFEILTGKSFAGNDTASTIDQARTALDGEPIPAKIASIIVNALDSQRTTSYKGIQKMAQDMDVLLFSGEYSPTTFNLAFFIHSTFRVEMEQLGEKLAIERERTYSNDAPTKVPTASPAPPLPPKHRGKARTRPLTIERGGSWKVFRLLGAGTLMVLAVAAFFLVKTRLETQQRDAKFDTLIKELAQEGQEAVAEEQAQAAEQLRLQNEQFQALLREQAELEKKRKMQDLRAEVVAIDKKISDAKREREAENERKQLQSELEKVKKILEEQTRRAQSAKSPPPSEPKVPNETITTQAKNNELEAESSPEPKAGADRVADSETVDRGNETLSKDSTTLPVTPQAPDPGDLVLLSDDLLKRPELVKQIPYLEVPKKAIRAGVVQKSDRHISFIMEALVDQHGKVKEVKLHRSPLPEGAQDYGMLNKAKKTAREMEFTAPTKMGVPVKVWIYVAVTFNTKKQVRVRRTNAR